MPRLIAVGWDEREARFVLGNIARGNLKIIGAGCAPVAMLTNEQGESTPDVAGALRATFAAHRVGRCQALVALSRGSVEIMHFQLPPAADNELPELVTNQAIRDSSTVDEKTPVDFLTTDDGVPGENRKVTVVTIPQDRLRTLRELCAKSGLKPVAMPLRTYAATSVLRKSPRRGDETCLLMNLIHDELDLTILSRGRPIFSRSVRLPDEVDDDALHERIIAELARTLAVATQDDWAGGAVQRIFLLAGPDEWALLADRLTERLALEVTRIDPFQGIDADPTVVPAASGRFAPLVGMLLDAAEGDRHLIDLLNPKKKPKPRSHTAPALLLVGVLLLLATVYYLFKKNELGELEQQVATLTQRHNELYNEHMVDQQRRILITNLAAWEQRGVNWLDQLRDMTLRLPPSEQFIATSLTCASGNQPVGQITLTGRLDHSSTIGLLERNFRDAYHQIQTQQLLPVGDSNYAFQFTATITTRRMPMEVYYARLPNHLKQYSVPAQNAPTARPTTPATTTPTAQPSQPAEAPATPAEGDAS